MSNKRKLKELNGGRLTRPRRTWARGRRRGGRVGAVAQLVNKQWRAAGAVTGERPAALVPSKARIRKGDDRG